MIGTFSIYEFLVCEEAFAPVTVVAAIFSEINIPLIEYFLQNILNELLMPLFRCADEARIFKVESVPRFFEDLCNLSGELKR